MEDPLGVRPCNEESIKAIAAKIMKMCRDERFYELPIEDIAKVLKHAEPLRFAVAEYIINKTVNKYKEETIKILPYMKFDKNVSGVQAEYLIVKIVGIQAFEVLKILSQLPEEDIIKEKQDRNQQARHKLKVMRVLNDHKKTTLDEALANK